MNAGLDLSNLGFGAPTQPHHNRPMIFDSFEGYERFIYKEFDRDDLSPPHGVWDSAKNQWADGCGSWSSEELARTFAAGMNRARELFRQGERNVNAAIASLDRARVALEKLL